MPANQRKILVDSVARLLRRGATRNLEKILDRTHAADIAWVMGQLRDADDRFRVYQLITDDDTRAETIAEATPEVQREILGRLEDEEILDVLGNLFADDAADIIEVLDDERASRVLSAWKGEDSVNVDQLLNYEADTAGGIMSPDFFALPEDTTVAEAIATLQASHEELEMVFYLYVVSDLGQLIGVCSLRQLVVSRPDQLLRDICETDVVTVTTHTDQEEVARLVARYNLLALPVVDDNKALVGIVTVDDVIDVLREEATEDIFKMAGAGAEAFADTVTVGRSVRARMPWLFASFVAGTFSMFVIGSFQDAIEQIAALAAFIPITLGMGGNAGTQSATIMVRGLALGRVPSGQIATVIGREIAVGAVGGAGYGALLAILAWALFGRTAAVEPWTILQLAGTVSLSVVCCMTVAAAIGACVPLLFQRVGVDPAVATNPIVTTTTDAIGVCIFFVIATMLLPL